MENLANHTYSEITDLHFAVWNMIKPVNFIWVDFADKCVRCGVKDEPDDPIKAEREQNEAMKDEFVELISYDEDGRPVLGFDGEAQKEEPYASYSADDIQLGEFTDELKRIDLLSWRNQYPSMREGLCWRIDVYYNGGEKHMSGQSRFPAEWASFGKALNLLVEKVSG